MQKWYNGVWNIVTVGCNGAPLSHCGNDAGQIPSTNVVATPLIAEKPYISTDGTNYFLNRPRVETNKQGPTSNYSNNDTYDFSYVYVAKATDSAATINAKLAQGLHLVLTPGIYNLDQALSVNTPG